VDIVASIPLTSLLAFMRLHFDKQEPNSIRDLSRYKLLKLPPSLTFFIALNRLIGWDISFNQACLHNFAYSLCVLDILYYIRILWN